jgi:hypothetical protein
MWIINFYVHTITKAGTQQQQQQERERKISVNWVYDEDEIKWAGVVQHINKARK